MSENIDNHSIELVITAPEPYAKEFAYKARTRLTYGVLVRLISEAESSLVIVSPFMQNVEMLKRDELRISIETALEKGVNINFISTKLGFSYFDVKKFREKFKGSIRFYKPQIDDEQKLGLHAKIYIADKKCAYVGSANFTESGLTEHFEMGFLVRGKIVSDIHDFLMYLIESKFLIEVRDY